MKIKLYNLISECVEKGIERGYRRSHKHTETPEQGYIFDNIHTDIMGELCEYIDFNDEIGYDRI